MESMKKVGKVGRLEGMTPTHLQILRTIASHQAFFKDAGQQSVMFEFEGQVVIIGRE